MGLLAPTPGVRLVDLGCGPGLYAERFAARGLQVTGIDYSHRSIERAARSALERGLGIECRCQDSLGWHEEAAYGIAVLIYGDYCTMSPPQRGYLCASNRRTLRPGGHLVLDVSTPENRLGQAARRGWQAHRSGFWRPGPHLVLEQGFAYPGGIGLTQCIVIDADGTGSVYRTWFQDFTAEGIVAELQLHGFTVGGLWGDLEGHAAQVALVALRPRHHRQVLMEVRRALDAVLGVIRAMRRGPGPRS